MPRFRRFDELFVVSDLHMGGRSGGSGSFQIFHRGPRLARFIERVAETRPAEEVALVLNGDVFDSLAEDEVTGYVALDTTTAERMMEHLYTDQAFAPVWQALAALVAKPHRHLVFVIGNHDIEMALPVVEDSIRHRLAGDDSAARARIHFATHGGGFSCRVGGARVFCTHGNELDEWNWVDYNLLGQLANAMNAGRVADRSRWKPNAGTRLVVDVMNGIKRRHPFVDLLKPELAAVVSVLMVLDKSAFRDVDLGAAYPILRDRIRGGLTTKRLLGAGETSLSGVSVNTLAAEAADQLLGASLRGAVATRSDVSEDELLRRAEEALADGRDPEAAALEQVDAGTLGVLDVVSAWVGRLPKPEGLRRALQDWLEDDTTFDVKHEDDLFEAMAERVGGEVDFVVTGHTHKPRALAFPGGARYYNSGTWIRTLRLTSEALADRATFESEVWPLLRDGRMEDLDTADIPGPGDKKVPLVLDRTNAVHFSAKDGSTTGRLVRVSDNSAGDGVVVRLEAGTKAHEVRR